MRLDVALVVRGMAPTRAKASELIQTQSVQVWHDNVEILKLKPSTEVQDEHIIRILDFSLLKYVSRAGLKLEAAAVHFGISFSHKTVLDCGQSTGGFTDYALQSGAKAVVGIEIGSNQLDQKIARDSRNTTFQKMNILDAYPALIRQIPDLKIDIAVVDVSFTSTLFVLPGILKFHPNELVVLIKPQFESSKKDLNKKGLIKDTQKAAQRSFEIASRIAALSSLEQQGIMACPITGGDGNQEYLTYFKGHQR